MKVDCPFTSLHEPVPVYVTPDCPSTFSPTTSLAHTACTRLCPSILPATRTSPPGAMSVTVDCPSIVPEVDVLAE